MRVSVFFVRGPGGVALSSCFRVPAATFLLFAEDSVDLDAFGDRLSSLRCDFLREMTGVWNFGGGSAPGMSIGEGNDPGTKMPLCDLFVTLLCGLCGEGEWYGKVVVCVKSGPAILAALI